MRRVPGANESRTTLFLLSVDGLEEKIDARAGRTFGRG